MKTIRAAFSGVLALAALFSMPAQAGGSLDISLADDMVRLGYDATQMGSGLHVSAAALHHQDDGDLFSAGLHVVDVRPSNRSTYIGVGAQALVFSTDGGDRYEDYDGAGLGVGGFFRYSFPRAPDVSLAGYVYYAPPVVTFMDAENMFVSDLRLQYSVIPTARIYAGYRYNSMRVEEVDKRFKLGDGGHVGVSIDF